MSAPAASSPGARNLRRTSAGRGTAGVCAAAGVSTRAHWTTRGRSQGARPRRRTRRSSGGREAFRPARWTSSKSQSRPPSVGVSLVLADDSWEQKQHTRQSSTENGLERAQRCFAKDSRGLVLAGCPLKTGNPLPLRYLLL